MKETILLDLAKVLHKTQKNFCDNPCNCICHGSAKKNGVCPQFILKSLEQTKLELSLGQLGVY